MVNMSGSSILIFMLKIVPILTAGPLLDWDTSFSLARFPHESPNCDQIPRVFILKDQWHTPNLVKKHIIVNNKYFHRCDVEPENYAITLKNDDFQTIIGLCMDEGTRIIFHTIGSKKENHFIVTWVNGRVYLNWDDDKTNTIGENLEELQREGFEEVRMKAMSREGFILLTCSDPGAIPKPRA
ncbi:hypothetical protein ENBRE01_0559 [Enteropsectra breve]|nr:hypothetical protein ENBRE01_0559 [Enteropsectra breve]